MRRERITQNRVMQLFAMTLGYRDLGNLEDEENLAIREQDLRAWLNSHSNFSLTRISVKIGIKRFICE
jgi:hypothetical protein